MKNVKKKSQNKSPRDLLPIILLIVWQILAEMPERKSLIEMNEWSTNNNRCGVNANTHTCKDNRHCSLTQFIKWLRTNCTRINDANQLFVSRRITFDNYRILCGFYRFLFILLTLANPFRSTGANFGIRPFTMSNYWHILQTPQRTCVFNCKQQPIQSSVPDANLSIEIFAGNASL